MKGELSRFAEEIRCLHRNLSGTARLQPIGPGIILTFTGDGKGHIIVDGIARNHFETSTDRPDLPQRYRRFSKRC
jgi:hypothetical protein